MKKSYIDMQRFQR